MFTIQAKKRDPKSSISYLRQQGEVPAVFYGPGKETQSVTVPEKDFLKVWKEAGESSPVTLETGSGKVDTLIHEVQIDPVSGKLVHVDFFIVDMTKEILVHVPIEFVGVSPAVKGGLGTLVKVLHEVEIKALPKDLPHAINVNIESLVDLQSQILVEQITLPQGVSLVTKGHDVVAAIAAQKEEVEETAPIDLSAIEVEKKGKKEEEGAAPAEEAK